MNFFISLLAKSPQLGLVYLSGHDYVEGWQNCPTAYLEGIFIIPDYRSQGIADKLLSFAISWAENRGISQLASDVEFDNQLSQNFHVKYGFREVGRRVHYVLDLK